MAMVRKAKVRATPADEAHLAADRAKREGRLTAAECNEFLATLPPVPYWPDRCTCQACKQGENA